MLNTRLFNVMTKTCATTAALALAVLLLQGCHGEKRDIAGHRLTLATYGTSDNGLTVKSGPLEADTTDGTSSCGARRADLCVGCMMAAYSLLLMCLRLKGFSFLFSLSFALSFFDVAGVGFCLFVVVDADEEKVACVVGKFGGIVLAFDLVDGSVGLLVVFQFND